MLLRLRVQGFKNLRDVEMRFGPLTCFVGPNGVGKSNIFDAIQFIRYLADTDVQGAAEAVRSPARGSFSPRELFWSTKPGASMSFEADILVPPLVVDDFGQEAKPTTTLLRYKLELKHASDPRPRLELVREELVPLQKGKARQVIVFPHDRRFRDSVVLGKRFGAAFISTDSAKGVVSLHGDGGSRGRPSPAGPSPRTILGGTNTAHYPTVLAARREMSAWHSLHLEPSALRSPDNFGGPDSVDEHGAHVAATLYRLGKQSKQPNAAQHSVEEDVLAEAATRLARLVPEVVALRLDEDRQREQRTIEVKIRGSDRWFGPRSLSDGTLRFLALVTMEMDPDSCRLLCMEEPENGIHARHAPDVVELLSDVAVDPTQPVSPDNPTRQVILNTHSSEILRQIDAPNVVFVDTVDTPLGRAAWVRPVDTPDNWRGKTDAVPLEELARLIGGSPLGLELAERQLELEFGSAL